VNRVRSFCAGLCTLPAEGQQKLLPDELAGFWREFVRSTG
jgi:hypothetical protein